jgi:gas vesicle protein
MSDRTVQQTVIGFAIGLGVGAALGILFAPKSGDETRRNLREGAEDIFDDALATGLKLRRRAKRAVNDVAERVMDVAGTAEQAYRKAKDA